MCILPPGQAPTIPAQLLPPDARQRIALAALGGLSISGIATDHDVSRQFVYQQLDRAPQGLDSAFAPSVPDQKVLFHLPVTKSWL